MIWGKVNIDILFSFFVFELKKNYEMQKKKEFFNYIESSV